MQENTDNMLTVYQVAERLNVSARTIWRMVSKSAFPQPTTFGRKTTRWKPEDVKNYLESSPVLGSRM